MKMTEKRILGLDLLRILAMIGVCVLHINNPLHGNGIELAQGINGIILHILESLFACAVDCFMIMSGYLMANSYKRNILKVIKLLVQTILYNELLYFFACLFGANTFSINKLVRFLFPASYFVILYIAVYMISPVLNRGISDMESGRQIKLLAIMVFIFSIQPFLTDIIEIYSGYPLMGLSFIGYYGDGYGYTLSNFIFLYILGVIIRYHTEKLRNISQHLLLICLLLLVLITTIFSYKNYELSLAYNNPIIVQEAVCCFLIFERVKKYSTTIISMLSSATFSVYLLNVTFINRLPVKDIVKMNPLLMVVCIIAYSCLIYIICFVVQFIYDKVMETLIYRHIISEKLILYYYK